jgi:carbamoyltransferase
MNILGLQLGHDAAAALVIDGRIVADAAEERFRRLKHFPGMPYEALAFCLSRLEPGAKLDAIAVASQNDLVGLDFMLGRKSRYEAKFLGPMVPPIYVEPLELGDVPLVRVDHHRAHAASAYFTSPHPADSLVVTMDGAGDQRSGTVWRGAGGRLTELASFPMSASLGWFYSVVTEALGWWHGDGEGKTMGLAPYGDAARVKGCLDHLRPHFRDGSCTKEFIYRPSFWLESGSFEFHIREASEVAQLVREHGREHIAAEAQRVLEEEALEVIGPWLSREKLTSLCCSGGVFLNVKLNQRVWEALSLDHHHVFPNAGDAGLAVGAALDAYYAAVPEAPRHEIQNLYWGGAYDDDAVAGMLAARGLDFERLDDPVEEAARALAAGKILGWFQGRMESGPRALGNRSILMSPLDPTAKDTLNERVKFREGFRPFCPSILHERVDDYVESGREERFMITSFAAKEERRHAIPAVVHVDGTLRVQAVRRSDNELYWRLIKRFGELSGEYVLLNTSFNIKGEPIIEHPRQALRCFYDTGLDELYIGNLRLKKPRTTS